MVPDVWPWHAMTQWEKLGAKNQEILGCQMVSPPHTIFPHSEMEDVGFSQRFTNCFLNFWSSLWTLQCKGDFEPHISWVLRYPKIAVDLPHCSQVLFVFLEFLFNYSTQKIPMTWFTLGELWIITTYHYKVGQPQKVNHIPLPHCWPCREPGDV